MEGMSEVSIKFMDSNNKEHLLNKQVYAHIKSEKHTYGLTWEDNFY